MYDLWLTLSFYNVFDHFMTFSKLNIKKFLFKKISWILVIDFVTLQKNEATSGFAKMLAASDGK